MATGRAFGCVHDVSCRGCNSKVAVECRRSVLAINKVRDPFWVGWIIVRRFPGAESARHSSLGHSRRGACPDNRFGSREIYSQNGIHSVELENKRNEFRSTKLPIFPLQQTTQRCVLTCGFRVCCNVFAVKDLHGVATSQLKSFDVGPLHKGARNWAIERRLRTDHFTPPQRIA